MARIMKARHILARQEAENFIRRFGNGKGINLSGKEGQKVPLESFFTAFDEDVKQLHGDGWATTDTEQPWKSHAPREKFDKLSSRQKHMLKILRLWFNRNGKKVESKLFAITDGFKGPFEGFCNALDALKPSTPVAPSPPGPTAMAIGTFSWD